MTDSSASAVLYGIPDAYRSRKKTPAPDTRSWLPEPVGPRGAHPLFALQPLEGGYWKVGWLGSPYSLMITNLEPGNYGGIWCLHRNTRRQADLGLGIQHVSGPRHLRWDQIPREVQVAIDLIADEFEEGNSDLGLRIGGSNTHPLAEY